MDLEKQPTKHRIGLTHYFGALWDEGFAFWDKMEGRLAKIALLGSAIFGALGLSAALTVVPNIPWLAWALPLSFAVFLAPYLAWKAERTKVIEADNKFAAMTASPLRIVKHDKTRADLSHSSMIIWHQVLIRNDVYSKVEGCQLFATITGGNRHPMPRRQIALCEPFSIRHGEEVIRQVVGVPHLRTADVALIDQVIFHAGSWFHPGDAKVSLIPDNYKIDLVLTCDNAASVSLMVDLRHDEKGWHVAF